MKEWHAAEKRGPHPLGRLTPPQSDMCQVRLDESWENEKRYEKTRQRKESPFSSLLASFCTSLPLRSSSPALILSTPFLMVTVRGAHLFCSVVFCCCHIGDASFLCICTSRQGGVKVRGGGLARHGCGICWSWHTFGNQKPKDRDTLFKKEWEHDIRAEGFGWYCKGKADVCDTAEDNTGMSAMLCAEKPWRKERRYRGPGSLKA